MKKFISIAALALTLAACSNDDDIAYTNEEIKIRTTIGTMTKTVFENNTTKFVAGDEFTLYSWDGTMSALNKPWINGVKVTLNDANKWIPASQILWKTEDTSHDFLGIYPSGILASAANLSAVSYTVNDNGDVIDNDILRAYSPAVKMPEDNTLTLPFKHIMAKLQVNLKFRNQWDSNPTVTSVTGNLTKTATIDFYTGTVAPATSGTSSSRALTPMATAATDYVYSYEIVAVPGDQDFNSIVITIDGKTYTYTYVPETTPDPLNPAQNLSLISGKVTTINLIVGRNQVDLDMGGSGSGSESGTGIFISDWSDNTSYQGSAYGD